MKTTVIRPDELGASEEELWRKFQTSIPLLGYPWFSLTYIRALSRSEERGRVAIVEDDGAIRAFIPYTKDDDGAGLTLGRGWSSLDGPISSNYPINLRPVIRSLGLPVWRFRHAPAGIHPLDPHRYHGSHHEDLIYVADLRDGYEGYKRSLPKKGAKAVSRAATSRRALQREVDEVSFEWNSKDPSHLSLLFDWKSIHFDNVRRWWSKPSVKTLLHYLADSDSVDCSGLTSVLYAGTEPISIILSLRRDNILAPWVIAYNPEYSRFSPGTIEWYSLIEEAATRGVTSVDFGFGDYSYKQRFGNSTYNAHGGGVWPSRMASAAHSFHRRAFGCCSSRSRG
jgi:CelD/BcsL family acetyltransferase involved in cellulose biosynthesis